MSEEFDKRNILEEFEYELNKLCRNYIGTATELKMKQRPLINLFEELVWAYETEKEKNKRMCEEYCPQNYKEKNKTNKFENILADDLKSRIDRIIIGKSTSFPCGWIYKKDLIKLINDIKWKEL